MPCKPKLHGARIPADSTFFGKVVPVLMLELGIVLATIVVLAFGVAFGFVPVAR
ncbi:MAG TPA: hypothetical protein QGI62_07390 [Anaerolineales bacterium]|jgi:hypothetical protein|nr:hypothetical protein [Anaerolineales bacterium]HJO33936.1 hypothetical protein [Anaerolineales bacterium]|tara:strand:- start:2255 stop:2416 length:162 start_codon:yes stop_codon:yes gene_type:complete